MSYEISCDDKKFMITVWQEPNNLNWAWLRASLDIFDLFVKKQADYGPNNIAMAGLDGIATRANDKVQRFRTLIAHRGAPTVLDETLEDTLMDLADYGILALLVLRGQWPKPALQETRTCEACGQAICSDSKA